MPEFPTGLAILSEIQRRTGVDLAGETGFVAGGAVAAVVLGHLDGREYPLRDVDLFAVQEKAAPGSVPRRASVVTLDYDGGSFDFIAPTLAFKSSGGYDVISSLTDGMLNRIGLRTDHPCFALRSLLLGFDLNSTQVGVDLATGELHATRAFRDFAERRQLEISHWATPAHSLIRWFEKRGCYGSSGDAAAQVRRYARYFRANAGGATAFDRPLLLSKLLRSRWWFSTPTLARWHAVKSAAELQDLNLIERTVVMPGRPTPLPLYLLDASRKEVSPAADDEDLPGIPFAPDEEAWWRSFDDAAARFQENDPRRLSRPPASKALRPANPDFLDSPNASAEALAAAYVACPLFVASACSLGIEASALSLLGTTFSLLPDTGDESGLASLLEVTSFVMAAHPEMLGDVRRFLQTLDRTGLEAAIRRAGSTRPWLTPMRRWQHHQPAPGVAREILCEADAYAAALRHGPDIFGVLPEMSGRRRRCFELELNESRVLVSKALNCPRGPYWDRPLWTFHSRDGEALAQRGGMFALLKELHEEGMNRSTRRHRRDAAHARALERALRKADPAPEAESGDADQPF